MLDNLTGRAHLKRALQSKEKILEGCYKTIDKVSIDNSRLIDENNALKRENEQLKSAQSKKNRKTNSKKEKKWYE